MPAARRHLPLLREIPLVPVALALAAGILLGALYPFKLIWFLLALLSLLMTLRYEWAIITTVAAVGALLTPELPDADNFVDLGADNRRLITAVVHEQNMRAGKTRFVLDIVAGLPESASIDRAYMSVRTADAGNSRFADLLPADTLLLAAIVERPAGRRNPGCFDFRRYLFTKGVVGLLIKPQLVEHRPFEGPSLKRMVFRTRQHLWSLLERQLGGSQAELAAGLLLGVRGYIHEETYEAFRIAGVAHVLAVSGLHVGFIVLMIVALTSLLGLGRGLQAAATGVLLLAYMILTGAPVSVIRAGFMAWLYLLGRATDRQVNNWNILATAAIINLAINPLALFTPGFQLSFSAVAGILYLYPRLKERLLATELGQRATGNSFGRGVVDLLLISFTAQAGVLPAQAYWFYSLPLYGLIANMVVVPLAGLVVMGGALGLVAMSVWSWLGEIFLNTCWAGISAIQWAATSVAQWPYASITTGRPNLLEGLAIVTAIVFLPEIGSWVTRRLLPRLTMLLLGIGIVAVWTPALGSRELEVTMLDVGQGDAIHLRLPAGQNILVDCGPRTRTFDAGRSIIRPYLHAQGITALEGVVVSHPHLDHYGGLSSLLDDFHIRSVWQPVQRSYYASYASVIDKAGKRGSDISVLRAGEALSFGAVDLLVLSPDSMHAVNASNDNDASLILKLEFGETSMLFMGDGEFEIERHLLVYDSLLTSDWLKIGHHGAVTASSKAFLRQVNPRGALISVGKYNRYGHPADETLARLHEHGLQVLRTDMDGAIRLNSDGRGWQVTQWR